MSEHIIQLTGLFCLLPETEERTDEAEAKILTGGRAVSYILQSTVCKRAQKPQRQETDQNLDPEVQVPHLDCASISGTMS